ncbi:uncharacterized protein LOC134468811 [Engraulis encrasicolus]|uniref:uncharacterized protein LOC134468811 n=1 Tax=Engraulis encrasicolus TaxID=184585 RepID=UPI002FD4A921
MASYYESDDDESNSCQTFSAGDTDVWYNEDLYEGNWSLQNKDSNAHGSRSHGHKRAQVHQKNEPCRFYNGQGCRNGASCEYMHVCRFSWIGSCRYGNNCRLKHVGDSDSDDSSSNSEENIRWSPRQSQTARNVRGSLWSNDQLDPGKLYKWQFNFGQGWLDIAHDNFIEAQYSKPFTEGMRLNKTPRGMLHIDFLRLQVRHGQGVQVRRLRSPNTAWLWYFKGEQGWSQYGETDSQGRCTKVNSSTLESEYQKNPQGCYRFGFNSYSYEIRFTDMQQENLSTHCRRQIRRRPSFPAGQIAGQAGLPQLMRALSMPRVSSPPKWQFSGNGNRWYDFQHGVGTNFECSTNCGLIEAEYQKNQKGSMNFTVSGQSYVLDFATMTQTNNSTMTTRKVRRL